jgi:hypothetical protein
MSKKRLLRIIFVLKRVEVARVGNKKELTLSNAIICTFHTFASLANQQGCGTWNIWNVLCYIDAYRMPVVKSETNRQLVTQKRT